VSDRAAQFTEFYREHYVRVLRFAERRITPRQTAEDVAAEVFRIAWGRSDPTALGVPWLFTTARNVLANEYRRAASARELPDRAAHRGGGAAALIAADASAGVAESDAVRRALGTLPPAQRELLRLAYWDDLDAAGIAEVLGVGVGAVWTRLTRARQAFALAYEKEETA
jgi:RNA polymerase sigma factor (sigma-70 family)